MEAFWKPLAAFLKRMHPHLAVSAVGAHKGQQLAVAAEGTREAAARDGAGPSAQAAQDGVAAGIDALKCTRQQVQRAAHRLRCSAHQALSQPLDKPYASTHPPSLCLSMP